MVKILVDGNTDILSHILMPVFNFQISVFSICTADFSQEKENLNYIDQHSLTILDWCESKGRDAQTDLPFDGDQTNNHFYVLIYNSVQRKTLRDEMFNIIFIMVLMMLTFDSNGMCSHDSATFYSYKVNLNSAVVSFSRYPAGQI